MPTTVTLDPKFASEPVIIPEGLAALVWERPGGSLYGARPSTRLHFADAALGPRPLRTLCGQRLPRGVRVDPPSYGEGVCARCVSAASKRAGVRATDLAARAQWSCSLSGARGLGDRDMVLQLIEHTDLSRPDDATLSELTRICERLRADDAADYAAISTGLLAALGTTPA